MYLNIFPECQEHTRRSYEHHNKPKITLQNVGYPWICRLPFLVFPITVNYGAWVAMIMETKTESVWCGKKHGLHTLYQNVLFRAESEMWSASFHGASDIKWSERNLIITSVSLVLVFSRLSSYLKEATVNKMGLRSGNTFNCQPDRGKGEESRTQMFVIQPVRRVTDLLLVRRHIKWSSFGSTPTGFFFSFCSDTTY